MSLPIYALFGSYIYEYSLSLSLFEITDSSMAVPLLRFSLLLVTVSVSVLFLSCIVMIGLGSQVATLWEKAAHETLQPIEESVRFRIAIIIQWTR